MATITTKYEIGQTVWHPYAVVRNDPATCPDCCGTGTWQALLPCGRGEIIECTTCEARGAVPETAIRGVVRRLTVGSIGFRDGEVQYMCQETGVGSGTIYTESTLAETEEGARKLLPGLVGVMQESLNENAVRQKRCRAKPARTLGWYQAGVRQAQRELRKCEAALASYRQRVSQ